MIFWQIMYLVALAVLLYAIVLQPLWESMRRRAARRWIRRAINVLEYNIEICNYDTQCLCAVFRNTRPNDTFLLWGCGYAKVLRDVIGFDYHRLAEHYGTTRGKCAELFGMKLLDIDPAYVGQCAWWTAVHPEGNEIRLRVLRDLELHCDGGFKNGTGLD